MSGDGQRNENIPHFFRSMLTAMCMYRCARPILRLCFIIFIVSTMVESVIDKLVVSNKHLYVFSLNVFQYMQ